MYIFLAGTAPWAMEAEVLAEVHQYKNSRMPRERTAPQEVQEKRRPAAQQIRDRWKESLANSPYGIHTIEDAPAGSWPVGQQAAWAAAYRRAQVLSRHGCFGLHAQGRCLGTPPTWGASTT